MNTTKSSAPVLGKLAFSILLVSAVCAHAVDRQVLPGHVLPALARLQPVDRLASTNHLKLTIGLPLRNLQALTNLLQKLYDPASAQYHRYLTPDQFAKRFGPTEEDYLAAIAFAGANGLVVTGTHPNRALLDVYAAVADIERTFQVRMRTYAHAKEARTFYAPDVEPTIDANVPLLHVSGLDDYTTPHPKDLRGTVLSGAKSRTAHEGSGPSGTYFGSDFRAAYVPGTSLTGAGQAVGLFELNGYYASDITTYETQTGLPNVPLQNVLIDGFNGSPGGRRPGGLNEEVALDIEMAISMAPGLSQVIVFRRAPHYTATGLYGQRPGRRPIQRDVGELRADQRRDDHAQLDSLQHCGLAHGCPQQWHSDTRGTCHNGISEPESQRQRFASRNLYCQRFVH